MKKIIALFISFACLASVIGIAPVAVLAEENYNYGEALQKSLMFYEFQMSGEMPDDIRTNWKGNSAMSDGNDAGVDLTGGWYDAGDHVKFNLPMSYSSTMLAWSYLESKKAYEQSGQDVYMLEQLKFVNDYFIRCQTDEHTYCFQVGSGGADHAVWCAAEVMQMSRPSYFVNDTTKGGGAVVASTAASLAAASMAFADNDADFSADCLTHAESLFKIAEKNPGDGYYDSVAGSFYKSWSGSADQLSWSAIWLYMATGEDNYLDKAQGYATKWGKEGQSDFVGYKWAQCWDDVHYGTAVLLAKETGNKFYTDVVERNLDYWSTGTKDTNERIKYTPKGLAWLDTWGSLRYATTQAFLAAVYADSDKCSKDKISSYQKFAKQQADYALGSSGRSYVCGFGKNSPVNPHHRSAHAGWENNVSGEPKTNRHVLYGALVGGPDSSDGYKDDRNDYVSNEVACDYNAGFTGLCAKIYEDYGGNPIADFNAVEEVGKELYLMSSINGENSTNEKNFIELKTVVYNQTAWPARVTDKLSFRFFVDLSDVYQKGYTKDDMNVISNYNQAGAVLKPLQAWDEENHIYYLEVDYDGKKLYPGGSEFYKKEIQYRIEAPCKWDFTKSYSYEGLKSGSTVYDSPNITLYDDSKLVYGNEPGEAPVIYAPEVEITSPADGAKYTLGDEIVITADASAEESDITNVEFYVGGEIVATDITAPYSASIFISDIDKDKDFEIYAKAYAENGKSAVSDKIDITVIVPEVPAPIVEIIEPLNGDKFDSSETVEIKAGATVEESAITKVLFYVDDKLIETDVAAPYQAQFKADGYGGEKTFEVYAKAFAENGKTAVSKTIEFKVDLPEAPLPTVVITSPLDGDEFHEDTEIITVKATANALDTNIQKVIFYADSKLIGEDTTYPYTADYKIEGYADEVNYKNVIFTAKAVTDYDKTVVSNEVEVKIYLPEKPNINTDLKVSVQGNNSNSTNTLANTFKIKKIGGDNLDLSKLKICYYYTIDGEKAQQFYCDNTGMQMNYAPWYSALTGNTKGTLVKLDNPTTTADYCLEITFNTSEALKTGAELTIATRVCKLDWSNYIQSNDYSYGNELNVCIYYDGELIYGEAI